MGFEQEPQFQRDVEPKRTGSEVAPDTRQQDKVIAFIRSGDSEVMKQDEVEVKGIVRNEFLQKVADGKIGDLEFEKALRQVDSPASRELTEDNLENLFGKVSENRRALGIIAELASGDFSKRDSVTSADLGAFIEKFPNPSDLEAVAGEFLSKVEEQNSPQKRQEYEVSLQKLAEVIYGKRLEYHRQIKLLRNEADEKYPALAERRMKTEERCREIAAEDNEQNLFVLLKDEYSKLLNQFAEKGYRLDSNFVYNDNYQVAREANPIIKAILKRFFDLRGVHKAVEFRQLENETLEEISKSMESKMGSQKEAA